MEKRVRELYEGQLIGFHRILVEPGAECNWGENSIPGAECSRDED